MSERDQQAQWEQWIQGVRSGDYESIQQFWGQYGGKLMRLADHNLQQQLRRRLDPEDVVQSAIRTFLRRAQDGQFEIPNDDGLWRLLCAITLNKVRQQARHHSQKKRAIQGEVALSHDKDETPLQAAHVSEDEPTPAEAAALVDLIQKMLDDSRSDQEREIITLRLQDHTNQEIAEKLGCSERTVRRTVNQLRQRLENLLVE